MTTRLTTNEPNIFVGQVIQVFLPIQGRVYVVEGRVTTITDRDEPYKLRVRLWQNNPYEFEAIPPTFCPGDNNG